jgi:NhaP-type Na+/H+ or K+/H+ antiporter
MTRHPAPDPLRVALAGIFAGVAIGVAVFTLADHFAHAHDWVSIPAAMAVSLVILAASRLRRRAQKLSRRSG